MPLAWETGGRWGDQALRFFAKVVDRKGGSRSEKASLLRYWMLRFSVRLVKAVVDVRRKRLLRFSASSDARESALEFDATFAEQDVSPFPVAGDP